MVHLARLIFVALLSLSASHAWAYGEVQKTSGYLCTINLSPPIKNSGDTPAQACSNALFQQGANKQYPNGQNFLGVTTCGGGTTGTCSNTFWNNSGGGTNTLSASFGLVVQCRSGSSEVPGGKCSCNLGLSPSDGQCVPYICPAAGSYNPVTVPDQKVSNVGPMCINGCTANPSSVKGASDGTLWATWPLKYTGGQCGGDVAADGVSTGNTSKGDAPVKCAANTCPGTVNGAAVCVACKDTTIPGASQTASAPAGSTPAPIDGVPGAVSASKETKCTQSDCTTTTTYRDASGAVVGTKSETKEQLSFCKDNPDASICKKGTFGGTCSATTCDGDAVQCALVQEVYKRNCEWAEEPTELKNVGQGAMTGQARANDHPALQPDARTVAFSEVISQADLIGSGCPIDQTLDLAGYSLVLPFGKLCAPLQLLGNLLVGISMFAAAFIVFKG